MWMILLDPFQLRLFCARCCGAAITLTRLQKAVVALAGALALEMLCLQTLLPH